MSRRYIELYSANRNRNQFPLCSSFEVPFAPTRQLLIKSHSNDPICTGPIYYKWIGGSPTFNSPWPNPSTITADSNSTPGCIFLTAATPYLSNIMNYYNGYTLTISVGQSRNIIGYDPTASKFLLDQPYTSATYKTTDTYTITDPSTNEKIHIPAKDMNGNCVKLYSEAYDGCYIVDETRSNKKTIIYSQIISYDFITQMATLNKPLVGWSSTDEFTIRKNLPQEKYTLVSDPVPNINTFIYQLNGQIVNIDYYSNIYYKFQPVIVPGMIVSLNVGEGYKELNYYSGMYIYNTSNSSKAPINGGGIYGLYFIKASAYNKDTDRVELLIDQSSIPEFTCYNSSSSSLYVENPSIQFLKTGDTINIVNYIKDNYSPLNYNGSVVSQSESVCYEISLISLILPNLTLRTGARIAFYPFVYVEFTNTTSPSGSSNSIIYSNSPVSNRALFIVPITDTNQPMNSSFVKVYSNMSQTIKFKPNDSLRFSVYLPDGKLFETVEQDYLSPYPPNLLIQINAVFGIRRI
jgi:hypothetical protein